MTTALGQEDGGVDILLWLRRKHLSSHVPHVISNWGRWEPIENYDPAIHGTNPERFIVTKAEFEEIWAEFRERRLL